MVKQFRHVHKFILSLLLLHGLLGATTMAALPVMLADGSKLPSLAPVIKEVSPAVVNISTYTTVSTYYNPLLQDPFFRRFFAVPEGRQQQKRTQSAGSGVIVDAKQGLVLSNHHVIEGADEIKVTLNDGREYIAELIGSDKQVDIALLKIEADALRDIKVADSRTLEVGDFVIAIGNPFGLGQTVTSGIVSAVGRSGLGIHGYEDFIQTDASINPGNSGGALINLRGELVGINSAIIAPAGGNVGIGFAIPTEVATTVMKQLVKHGVVKRGRLGVFFQDLTPELAEAFSLSSSRGAVIARVIEGSPADDVGLQPGDIVMEVNGHEVRNANDLLNRIGLTPVGEKMALTILRDGDRMDFTAEISETPVSEVNGGQLHEKLAGVRFKDYVSAESGEMLGILIVDINVGSYGARAGLEPGDLVVASNRIRVKNIKQLAKVVEGSKQVLLRIERAGRSFYAVIR